MMDNVSIGDSKIMVEEGLITLQTKLKGSTFYKFRNGSFVKASKFVMYVQRLPFASVLSLLRMKRV